MRYPLILALFVISYAKSDQGRHKRSILNDKYHIWKNGNVPVKFVADVFTYKPLYDAALPGLDFWLQNTCLNIHPDNSTDPLMDALVFQRMGWGCFSFLGRQSFNQRISLDVGCEHFSTVTYLIARALGVLNENNRSDRDDYIKIETDNLSQFAKNNQTFLKAPFRYMNDYMLDYDYGSGMHAAGYEYSKNGQRTITTLDPNYQATIGQIDGPSFIDVKRVNRAYCNLTCNAPAVCQNGGYVHPRDCRFCHCPKPFVGINCESIDPGTNNCGNLARDATDTFKNITVSGNKTCSFVLTAPGQKQVNFVLMNLNVTNSGPIVKQGACLYNYLEINYRKDITYGGARLCNNMLTNVTVPRSESNKLVLIFKGHPGASFSLRYKAV